MVFPKGFGTRLLAVIPAIIIMVLCNVSIAFTIAGVVLLYMFESGINKHVALGVSILIAIGVHLYIAWNHKIRNFVNQGVKHE